MRPPLKNGGQGTRLNQSLAAWETSCFFFFFFILEPPKPIDETCRRSETEGWAVG